MAVSSPVDAAVNPNNTQQRYVLWGNGRIDNYGGAPPIVGQDTWYDWIDQPVAVALHIIDWATGAGYMFDTRGGFHMLNGAPEVGVDGIVQGVPYVDRRNYVDWAWHPDNNGQGYALSGYGQIHHFGGATPAPRQGGLWTQMFAKKLEVSWDATLGLRSIMLDAYGGLHGDFGAVVGALSEYWAHKNFARDFVVTDWATGSGHVMDLFGGVHEFGSAPDTYGWPYNTGGDVARVLKVLSASSPQRFWQVWSGGQQYEYVSSTPPTVTAGGFPVSPPSTVTTTTRPTLAWSYSDPQADAQTAWELYVFTQDFVSDHNMADPSVWAGNEVFAESGIDPTTRGVVSPVDLLNGQYRFYVRARDAAGQWSAWSSRAWTQNIAAPATPTGLTAVADEGTFSVALSVNATTGSAADLVRFEFSDDGGVSWAAVRGASAVGLEATTTATDWDPPLGVARSYRATAYGLDPRVASRPSATATATVTTRTYVLTAVGDPTLGGVVNVQEPVEWTRPFSGGLFQGLGADWPTVLKDGGTPKGRRSTVQVFTDSEGAWELVDDLVMSRSTLVYRDPFGSVRYCELVGDGTTALMPGAALRHLHTLDLPLVEVRPPA